MREVGYTLVAAPIERGRPRHPETHTCHAPPAALGSNCWKTASPRSPGTSSAPLANPAAAGGDQFGGAVAVAGNLVVVGAPVRRPRRGHRRRLRLRLQPGHRALVATLNNPDPAPGDKFGWSVTLAQRDGVIHVGAPFDDPGGVADSGAVYTF